LACNVTPIGEKCSNSVGEDSNKNQTHTSHSFIHFSLHSLGFLSNLQWQKFSPPFPPIPSTNPPQPPPPLHHRHNHNHNHNHLLPPPPPTPISLHHLHNPPSVAETTAAMIEIEISIVLLLAASIMTVTTCRRRGIEIEISNAGVVRVLLRIVTAVILRRCEDRLRIIIIIIINAPGEVVVPVAVMDPMIGKIAMSIICSCSVILNFWLLNFEAWNCNVEIFLFYVLLFQFYDYGIS